MSARGPRRGAPSSLGDVLVARPAGSELARHLTWVPNDGVDRESAGRCTDMLKKIMEILTLKWLWDRHENKR